MKQNLPENMVVVLWQYCRYTMNGAATIHVETVCPTLTLHVSCGDTKPIQAVLLGALLPLH